jgi:hypothetical protein
MGQIAQDWDDRYGQGAGGRCDNSRGHLATHRRAGPRLPWAFHPAGDGNQEFVALKSALEIALEKQEKHEELSAVTEELLEHVRLLDEGWKAIRPRQREPETGRSEPLRRAA